VRTEYSTHHNKVIYGDALETLRSLPDGLVQCCVTSPPYWGLRDYGVEGQLGLERTPEEYVEKLVEVFREVRRVLRDDGTLWLNLGDSYAAGCMTGRQGSNSSTGQNIGQAEGTRLPPRKPPIGLKPKDLCGIPWRVAFALQADGWWLRSDSIWAKPNPMPESITDRPTRAHEYIFLLTKRPRYFYDADAIREESETGWMRNKRSVWHIATKPFSGAHFATFPPALVDPCVLAGTSPQACPHCGAPWERVAEQGKSNWQERVMNGATGGTKTHGHITTHGEGMSHDLNPPERKTIGWRATCSCEDNDGSGRCLVLDPFAGSGTVGEVAIKHGRDYLLIELNRDYEGLIKGRLGLFYEALETAGVENA